MIIVSFGYNEDYLFSGDVQELGVLDNLRRVEEVTIDGKKCFKITDRNNVSIRFIDPLSTIIGAVPSALSTAAENLSKQVEELSLKLRREQVYSKYLLEAKLLNVSEETWRKQVDNCSSYGLNNLKPEQPKTE